MEENKIEVEEIHYEQMNKTELVDICRQQDTQLKNYEIVLNNERETNKETLSKVQIEKLVQFAIDNKLTDYTKCHILKNRTGRDIVEIIRLTDETEIEE
jgi:hypothetical protein